MHDTAPPQSPSAFEVSINRATVREMLADIIREEVQPQALGYPAAARYISVSERQMKRLVAAGEIACLRYPGRLVRFRVADLDAFLQRHRVARRRGA